MTEFNDTERESKVKQENVKAQMSNFNKPTNPPAFLISGSQYSHTYGMTLRDYFAARAMQTYIADKELVEVYCYLEKDVKQELATTAYMMADAMLKAREA
jgi:hypothetical protein